MNTVEQSLTLLESLSTADRRWILERLPAPMKERLIMGDSSSVVQAPVQSSAELTLNNMDPSSVAEALAAEPSWIIEALVQTGDPEWRKQVLKRLPLAIRSTVSGIARHPQQLSKPVLDSLSRAACVRVQTLSRIEHQQPAGWLHRCLQILNSSRWMPR